MWYNNTKKRWENEPGLQRGIIYIDKNYTELGHFDFSPLCIPIDFCESVVYLDNKEHCSLPLYWNNQKCCYSIKSRNANNIITESKCLFNYPIERCYNFSKLNLKPKQIKLNVDNEFQYIKKFTFGIEYETCGGNIPWLECIDTNLVPLYDGSIKGHEYVTFPMTYTELSIVKEHLQLLHTYTNYDQDCSLHIHFGEFPIIYKKIEALCKFWYYFQYQIANYIPVWSYYVENYKRNGKSYNKPWPNIRSLTILYNRYTDNNYEDDRCFYLLNKYDEAENRKWEVAGRYFNMNIMRLISGQTHKTVEFRFLRPTTNYFEIKWYLLILGSFLNYVIISEDNAYNKITIDKVLNATFPKEIVAKIMLEGKTLRNLHKVQTTNNDHAGIKQDLKDFYLKVHNFSM